MNPIPISPIQRKEIDLHLIWKDQSLSTINCLVWMRLGKLMACFDIFLRHKWFILLYRSLQTCTIQSPSHYEDINLPPKLLLDHFDKNNKVNVSIRVSDPFPHPMITTPCTFPLTYSCTIPDGAMNASAWPS